MEVALRCAGEETSVVPVLSQAVEAKREPEGGAEVVVEEETAARCSHVRTTWREVMNDGLTPKPPAAPATRATNLISRRRVMLERRAELGDVCHVQTQRPTKATKHG